MRSLPPSVHGKLPHSLVFLLCTYAVLLTFPAFCFYVMHGEASDPVKEFMSTHVITAIACGLGAGLLMYCLLHPQPEQFIAIPFALMPIAAVNAVAAMVPPVLWMVNPVNIGIR